MTKYRNDHQLFHLKNDSITLLSIGYVQPLMGKYVVYIDDNFHYMEEGSRIKLGQFEICEEAVNACKGIVEEYFSKLESKHSFKELWEGYMLYGEDPFIVTDDANCKFSAWDYAKQRCKEFSSENEEMIE